MKLREMAIGVLERETISSLKDIKLEDIIQQLKSEFPLLDATDSFSENKREENRTEYIGKIIDATFDQNAFYKIGIALFKEIGENAYRKVFETNKYVALYFECKPATSQDPRILRLDTIKINQLHLGRYSNQTDKKILSGNIDVDKFVLTDFKRNFIELELLSQEGSRKRTYFVDLATRRYTYCEE